VSPFLTSYVLHVYQTAQSLKYDVDKSVMERGYDYLQREMARQQPVNEGWWPAYTAWESFAVKVLVEGGRNQDSNINRLYGYLDRMPVFAIAYLRDALLAKGESGPRAAELRRRMDNAMLPEAGSVHVEELADPYLLYFWNSNIRSTAIALDTLVRAGEPQNVLTGMVRWLISVRKDGRWSNTQENAVAMHALVDYYRKYESVTPNFTATIKLGTQDLLKETFNGRSTTAVTKDVPMAQVVRSADAKEISVSRAGEGTAFYVTRLTYAPDAANLTARDNGFKIERLYMTLKDDWSARLQPGAPLTTFNAGDLIRVTLTLDLPKERRFVAMTDPIPAGFEPVETWFATTARDVAKQADADGDPDEEPSWQDIWRRGTFDHVERHDDRVLAFATRLSEGHHEFSYVVRATTSGTFQAAPARVEQMYEPEISGRAATVTIEVKR